MHNAHTLLPSYPCMKRFAPKRFGSHVEFVNIYIFWIIHVIFQSGNSLNAIECKPVPTRVLNPNASKAS